MALIMATSAHPSVMVAEHPAGGALQDVDGRNYTAVVGYRQGGVTIFEGTGSIAPEHSDTWFHVPIPTISWLTKSSGGNDRAFLDSFGVMFKLKNCSVNAIHAWDGGFQRFLIAPVPNTIADQQMTGDWSLWGKVLTPSQTSGRVQMTNLFAPRENGARHAMLNGLCISIRVNFVGGSGPKRIIFFGASALWHDTPTD